MQKLKILWGASILFIYAGKALANMTFPYTETWNCGPWSAIAGQTNHTPAACGNWSMINNGCYLASTCQFPSSVTPAANYPGGLGGNGFREYVMDGHNYLSGAPVISFPTPQSSVWIRWYMRYQPGFNWNTLAYHKLMYFHNPNVCFEWYYNTINLWVAGATPADNTGPPNTGWYHTFAGGGKVSDGSWHATEIHIDTSNGEWDTWIDGYQINHSTGLAFIGASWTYFEFLTNQSDVNNSSGPIGASGAFVDIDDIAISNTGYIGLLPSPAAKAPPAAPRGLTLR